MTVLICCLPRMGGVSLCTDISIQTCENKENDIMSLKYTRQAAGAYYEMGNAIFCTLAIIYMRPVMNNI